jgi:carbohydrate kinase (thermoresistant glucokinase family)
LAGHINVCQVADLEDDEAVLLMGVSGSGKSTVGQALADRLGWIFEDGDDLHPPANVAKMAAGHPLTDDDRAPWLAECGDWLLAQRALDRPAILACSALKRAYRDELRRRVPGLRIVYLQGARDMLLERIGSRQGHFFPATLLDAQLADLEPPTPDEHPIVAPITLTVPEIVEQVADALTGPTDDGPTRAA